jgi:hypothetical protein
MEEILESLRAIEDAINSLTDEIEDISVSLKTISMFKLIEIHPEAKEKAAPFLEEISGFIDELYPPTDDDEFEDKS